MEKRSNYQKDLKIKQYKDTKNKVLFEETNIRVGNSSPNQRSFSRSVPKLK